MMKFLPKNFFVSKSEDRKAELYRAFMRAQAKKGGQLFGPIPNGHHREFFCLDQHSWVWHEEWTDESGQRKVVTTRYDVRPNGILKSQGNQSYQIVTGEELRNLYRAAKLFRAQVLADAQTA